jgi:hypothetical protein
MKKFFLRSAFVACVSCILFASVFTACKDDDDPAVSADTTALVALISECQTLSDEATTTDYPQAAITSFQSTLTAAKTALADKGISQTAVDNLVVQLTAAKETFLAAAYGAIPGTALLFGLSFDEGTGTQLTTTGQKAYIAKLTAGPAEIFGVNTSVPGFITGKVGKAMYFSKGGHLEITNYTASDLLPTKLSIAVWVKPDSTRAGNYIMSFNYWNSWKFQIQEQNKPFFTIKTGTGNVDADNEADFSAPNTTWTHLAISMDLTTEKLEMYVNGVNTKEWTSVTKTNLKGTLVTYKNTLPLMIGACTTYAEANTEWTWSWPRTPAAWDHFVGAMDELKVYNVALTDGQVAKLYKDENN